MSMYFPPERFRRLGRNFRRPVAPEPPPEVGVPHNPALPPQWPWRGRQMRDPWWSLVRDFLRQVMQIIRTGGPNRGEAFRALATEFQGKVKETVGQMPEFRREGGATPSATAPMATTALAPAAGPRLPPEPGFRRELPPPGLTGLEQGQWWRSQGKEPYGGGFPEGEPSTLAGMLSPEIFPEEARAVFFQVFGDLMNQYPAAFRDYVMRVLPDLVAEYRAQGWPSPAEQFQGMTPPVQGRVPLIGAPEGEAQFRDLTSREMAVAQAGEPSPGIEPFGRFLRDPAIRRRLIEGFLTQRPPLRGEFGVPAQVPLDIIQ